jgi:hypothetical protein
MRGLQNFGNARVKVASTKMGTDGGHASTWRRSRDASTSAALVIVRGD